MRRLATLAHFVREKKVSLFFTLILALVSQLLEFHGWYSSVEGKVANAYLKLISNGTSNGNDIYVIEIDDMDYETFFLRQSPLDPVAVANLVEAIVQPSQSPKRDTRQTGPSIRPDIGAPGVLGIDLLTDSDRYSKDQKVISSLNIVRGQPVPVIWVADALPWVVNDVTQPLVDTVSFPKWLLGYHDIMHARGGTVLGQSADESRDQWALPMFPTDEDDTVRRMSRVWLDPTGRPHATWARMVADKYCVVVQEACSSSEEAEEVYITTTKDIPRRQLRDVFRCADEQEGKACHHWLGNNESFRGKLVLLGGTFSAARDVYKTSFDKQAGLMLNAMAVSAERRHFVVSDAPRPATIVIDLWLSCSIIFLSWAWRSPSRHRMSSATAVARGLRKYYVFALAAAVLMIIAALFSFFHFLWSTWILIVIFSWPLDSAVESLLEAISTKRKAHRASR